MDPTKDIAFKTTRDRRLRLQPALAQDTDYMVEKTYQLAPYVSTWGLFNALVTNVWFTDKSQIWVPKMRFSKMYIFGAQIESEGPGMVSS